MGSERAVAAALVDWINSCPISPKIQSLSDLADGSTISKVLQDIDPGYFGTPAATEGGDGAAAAAATRSNGWLSKFQKLRKLHRDLTKYYTETLGHRLPSQGPNLTAIAKDGNLEEAIKLAKIIVATAVLSDRKEEYIAMIQELSPSSQTEMMNILNEMILLDQGEEDGSQSDDVNVNDANQFRVEEEMAKLVGEKEAIEAENKQLKDRLKETLDTLEHKEHDLSQLEGQLSGGGREYAGRSDPVLLKRLDDSMAQVGELEYKLEDRDNKIAEQETAIAALNRRIDNFKAKVDASDKYRDDLYEAHRTIEKLSKSQNVVEKYRKKLEGMGELEQQVKTLDEQNVQMLKDLRVAEESAKQVPGLKRTIEQYKKQVTKLEGECTEMSRVKHALVAEKQILLAKADGAEYQRTKDQERIRNLDERIRELESGLMSEAVEEYGGDLHSELAYSTKTKTELQLKLSRYEDEIRHLKEGGGAGSDNIVLKHMVEDATRARDKLEYDYLEVNTAKLILESQLYSIRAGTTSEGSAVMLKLRQTLLDTEKHLSELKVKHSETLAELTTVQHALTTALSDLSLVDADKLEALKTLKQIAYLEHEGMEGRGELLEKVRDLEIDLRNKTSQLNTVLLEKDALSSKLAEQKDTLLEKEEAHSELKSTVAAFQGNAEGRDAALGHHVQQLTVKLDKQRTSITKQKAHIKKQIDIIKGLKEQLEATITADSDEKLRAMEERLAELKRRKKEEVELLDRENLLMATAYHDQASRLQMNSVVLLRRSDAQASWLNQQRVALDSSVRR